MKQQHLMNVKYNAGWGAILSLCLILNAGAGLAVTRYVANCCIGWQSNPSILGENNITNDPAFVAPLDGDFQLTHGSLCINSGVNQPWMTDAVDLGGRQRIL